MKQSILSLCFTSVMALIIGTVGIFSVMTVNESYSWSYEYNIEAMPRIAKVLEYTQRLKTLPYMAFDYAYVPNYEQQWTQTLMDFEKHMESFEVDIVTPEVYMAFAEMREAYFNEYKPRLLELLGHMKSDESRDVLPYFIELMKEPSNKMTQAADYCMNLVSENAAEEREANGYTARTLVTVIIVLIVLEIVIFIIILAARYKGLKNPAYQNTYSRRAAPPPVYAMYPVDPSNPSNPPHATHILYPVMTPVNPPQADESGQ